MKTQTIRHTHRNPSATAEPKPHYRSGSRCPLEALEWRLMLAAGDIETSFGVNGLEIYNSLGPAVTMALLPDGKIVVAMEHKVARFTASGALDKSFGTRGVVNMNFDILDMKLTADGHIVLVGDIPPAGGSTNPPQGYVSMLNSNGAPEGTFNGIDSTTHLPELSLLVPATTLGTRTSFSSVAVESDGTVLLGGLVDRGPNPNSDTPPTLDLNDADVMAFNPDGNLDVSFGSDGEMTTTDGTWFSGPTMLLLQDDDIELIGNLHPQITILYGYEETLTPIGTVIPGAGLPGGSYGPNADSTVRPDGTVAAALGADIFNGPTLAFNSTGVPIAFQASNLLYPNAGAGALAATASNQVVLAAADVNNSIVIARVNADGTPDTGFGFGGTSQITLNPYDDGWTYEQSVAALAVANDGDILAAGNFSGHLLLLELHGGSHSLSRAVPSASLTSEAPDYFNSADIQVEITYTSASGMNVSSLNDEQVQITGPDGYSQIGTYDSMVSQTALPLIASYTFPSPGTTTAANGVYGVYMIGGQVADNEGRTVPAGKIGAFTINNSPTPTPTPTPAPTFNMAPISPYAPVTGQQYMTFSVYLSSPDGIDLSSLGDKNFSVTSNDGQETFKAGFVSDVVSDGGDIVIATYRVAAPSSVPWTEPAVEDDGVYYPSSGNYMINIVSAPTDMAGGSPYVDTYDDGTFGNFSVLIRNTQPTATLVSIQPPTSGFNPTSTFIVRYTPGSGATGMDAASLSGQAVAVQPLNSEWNSLPPDEGGSWAQAQSTAVGRGGITTVTYNAYGIQPGESYVIRIPGMQAAILPPYATLPEYGPLDSNGTAVPGGIIGTFNTAHSGSPTDLLLTSASTVDSRGNITFQVQYNAFASIDVQTLDSAEILVTGPHGFSAWAQLVEVDANTYGTSRVVTYAVRSASGLPLAPGKYYIQLARSAIADLSGKILPAGSLGSIIVAS